MFFASYGSFIHELTGLFLSGQITRDETVNRYLIGFAGKTAGKTPSADIRLNYFRQGLKYLSSLTPEPGKILGVEEPVSYSIGQYPFIGFIDLVTIDPEGNLVITDHKSRTLKPRSSRKNPTASDRELDAYLRQLYLYSIPVSRLYGRTPDRLVFNCYRSGLKIVEPFNGRALKEAIVWASDSVQSIIATEEWRPNMDYFQCNYLCSERDQCEYFALSGFGGDRHKSG